MAITTDTNLETIFITARDTGIGVTLKKRVAQPESVRGNVAQRRHHGCNYTPDG